LAQQTFKHLGHTAIRGEITVTVRYSDWPNVDILPALPTTDPKGFLISTESGAGWQPYSPDEHDRIVSAASKRLGPRFKKLTRIIKWWNYTTDTPLKSYEIEALVAQTFPSNIPDYTEAICRIFYEILRKLASDGVREGDSVQLKAGSAWSISRQAQDLATAGRDIEGLRSLLRRLFGDSFPHVSS
jgi:hypothetical protein